MDYVRIKGTTSDGIGKRYVQVDKDGRLVKAASVNSGWKTAVIDDEGKTGHAVDLGDNYEYLQVDWPTLDAGTFRVMVGRSEGGTYRDFYITQYNGEFQGARSQDSKTGAINLTMFLGGWRYIKIYSSATQSTAEIVAYVRGITF